MEVLDYPVQQYIIIMKIGGDAPFVYLPDIVFKQIYTTPTLLSYGFDMNVSFQPQMEEFLSSYVEKNPSVTYTSAKLLKEQLNSVASMVLVIGVLCGRSQISTRS